MEELMRIGQPFVLPHATLAKACKANEPLFLLVPCCHVRDQAPGEVPELQPVAGDWALLSAGSLVASGVASEVEDDS